MKTWGFSYAAAFVGCFALLSSACSPDLDDDAASDEGNLTDGPAEADAARKWVGDWLAVVAAKPKFDVISSKRKVPSLVLRASGEDVGVVFRSEDGEDDPTLATFGKMLRFPKPAGIKGSELSLGDDSFSAAFGDALSKQYAKVPGTTTDPAYAASRARVDERRRACKASSANGDCHIFEKQKESGQALSTFELGALVVYTGDEYAPMNTLLRSRTFQAPTGEAPTNAASVAYTVDAVFALGAVSALNKLDKVTSTTYRGSKQIFPSCAKAGPKIAPSPTSVDAAISRFCDYFGAVDVYQDCAFASSSLDPEVALKFAGVSAGADAPGSASRPIVFELAGKTGALVEGLSMFPDEREVLFKPNVGFSVDRSSRSIVLSPAKAAEATHADFEAVSCGTKLTADQLKRVSHFRVKLREQ